MSWALKFEDQEWFAGICDLATRKKTENRDTVLKYCFTGTGSIVHKTDKAVLVENLVNH